MTRIQLEPARTEARQNLDYWLTQFQRNQLLIDSEESAKTEARRVVRFIRQMHPGSSNAARIHLSETANAIEQQSGFTIFDEKHVLEIVKKVRLAADLEDDAVCPWSHLYRVLGDRHTRKHQVARTFWELNDSGSMEWTVSLDLFAEKVWGDDDEDIKTIRPAVSTFRRFLKSHGIVFEARVHDRSRGSRIDCKLVLR